MMPNQALQRNARHASCRAGAYPKLSRLWIKTGDPRTPLKGVWIDDSKLHRVMNDVHAAQRDNEPAELEDDHLCLAA